MRPSIIATKINADIRADRDNFTRAAALSEYCAMPQNSRGNEKCVAFHAFNFSEPNPSLDRIKSEFDFDMTKARLKDNELLAHWVISWKDGQPAENEAVEAAKDLLADLGYGDNKFTVAIHNDTDNVHCHICACKVDPWKGKIIREGKGWWKNESQKSLARIAHKYGWNLEAGARFTVPANPRQEIIECHTPQGTVEILRPKVEVKERDPEKAPAVRYHAAKTEQRTGIKSGQRRLQEALSKFMEEHEQDLSKWKVGQFHRALAEIGISCERVQHGNRYGLVYSLDDETHEAASAVCPALAYEPLLKKLSAKGWRDAREEHKKILEEARAARLALPEPLPKEQEKMTYSKSVLDIMRKIPTSQVFDALGMKPQEKTKTGKPVKTAFDVCFLAGQTYAQAADFLAQKFPKVLKMAKEAEQFEISCLVDEKLDAIKAQGIDVKNMGKAAKSIATFMTALQITNMDVTTNVPYDLMQEWRARGERLDNLHGAENLTFGEIVTKLGILAKLNMAGKPEIQPVGIFCEPKWPEGKIGFLVDDVQAELLDKHPPTAILATSNESRQAFYVMPRKYPVEFYDWLAAKINEQYGDVAVKSTRHPTRLPGFQNQKRANPSVVKLEKCTRSPCKSMEDYADSLYPQWEKQGHYVESLGNKDLSTVAQYETIYPIAEAEVWREIKAGNRRYTESEVKKLIAERIRTTDWSKQLEMRDALMGKFYGNKGIPKEKLFCPQELEKIGLREQARLRALYGDQLDRSRCDWMIAEKLYENGANIIHVYTWMLNHMTQAQGTKDRLRSEKEIERQARRIAVKRAPVSMIGEGSEFHKLVMPERQTKSSLDLLNTEQDRERELDARVDNIQITHEGSREDVKDMAK